MKILNEQYLEERLSDLRESLKISESPGDKIRAGIEHFEIKALEDLRDNSKELEIIDVHTLINEGFLFEDDAYTLEEVGYRVVKIKE